MDITLHVKPTPYDSLRLICGRSYVQSGAVMAAFGYTSRSAFWEFVRRSGIPHIRFNARKIMFDEVALKDWLDRRSSNYRA